MRQAFQIIKQSFACASILARSQFLILYEPIVGKDLILHNIYKKGTKVIFQTLALRRIVKHYKLLLPDRSWLLACFYPTRGKHLSLCAITKLYVPSLVVLFGQLLCFQRTFVFFPLRQQQPQIESRWNPQDFRYIFYQRVD